MLIIFLSAMVHKLYSFFILWKLQNNFVFTKEMPKKQAKKRAAAADFEM